MNEYRIITIPGDGIGPELMESTIAVLEAVQEVSGALKLNLEEHEAGAGRYAKYGKRISDETLQACHEADGILKSPVGDPAVRTPEGTEGGLLGGVLRTSLDVFANMRPIKLYPGIRSPLAGYEPGGIDYVVIRENTEGLYASRDKGVGGPEAVADTLIITRKGAERVARFAFELARREKRRARRRRAARHLRGTRAMFCAPWRFSARFSWKSPPITPTSRRKPCIRTPAHTTW